MTYSLREAAPLLGIKVRTLREWIKRGKIKAMKADNDWYWKIPDTEVTKKLEEREESEKR